MSFTFTVPFTVNVIVVAWESSWWLVLLLVRLPVLTGPWYLNWRIFSLCWPVPMLWRVTASLSRCHRSLPDGNSLTYWLYILILQWAVSEPKSINWRLTEALYENGCLLRTKFGPGSLRFVIIIVKTCIFLSCSGEFVSECECGYGWAKSRTWYAQFSRVGL